MAEVVVFGWKLAAAGLFAVPAWLALGRLALAAEGVNPFRWALRLPGRGLGLALRGARRLARLALGL